MPVVYTANSWAFFNSQKEDEDGTPIWKVGRYLMDSLSKGKMRRTKIFGAPLEDLPLNCQGMPKIAHRLCFHLEQYGEYVLEIRTSEEFYLPVRERDTNVMTFIRARK